MKNIKIGAGVCTLVGITGMIVGSVLLKKHRSQEQEELTKQDMKEIDELFEEAE